MRAVIRKDVNERIRYKFHLLLAGDSLAIQIYIRNEFIQIKIEIKVLIFRVIFLYTRASNFIISEVAKILFGRLGYL